jgi:membrane protein DedA with SNARE-associated domain
MNLTDLLTTFGYSAVVVLVALEGFGVPLPGETMLITAAVYAGATHRMALPLIIAAAFAGAVVGSTGGYAVGYWGGFRLLVRFGKYIRLNEPRVKLGRYLFLRHGGKVVFFGRFVSILRTYAAFLAGTARMPPWRFLVFNAAGAIAWASLWALVAYRLGEQINRLSRPADIALGVAAVLAAAGVLLFWRRNEARLIERAERALPGPLDSF